MTTLRFITRQPGGASAVRELPAQAGQSVMQVAVAAGVDAIAADCGGLLTCATCHVYLDPSWAARLPAPSAEELSMLEFTAAPRRDTSRLSCQIIVGPDTDGLVVELPERQY
jgi:ferredoxin, 2Fe-2S